MPKLKGNYLVQKRNVLNELRSNNMTLQELRFFSIYLSKINARDLSTRVVRFSLDDFRAIMELGRIDVKYMKGVTNSLLCKIVNVPLERGFTAFQLFKECTITQDKESEEWYFEIDAHDKALPLMFEFKSRYFSYHLWNALNLKSSNQLRMYEILKQYEDVGYRILSVEELRELLGISKNEYPRFANFKIRVLDACQQALEEHTDIKFTYESHGKKGNRGKILNLKFTIETNSNYTDQLTLEKFIDQQNNILDTDDIIDVSDLDEDEPPRSGRIDFFMDAFEGEFTFNQVVTLHDKLRDVLPPAELKNELRCYHYFNDRYNAMVRQAEKGEIHSRFGYVKSLIGKTI